MNKTKINNMKKYLLIVVFVSAVFAAKSQGNGTLYLTKSLAAESIKNVEAKTSGGSIEVSGGNAQEARIEVYVSMNGHHTDLSKEEIKEKLNADYDLTVSASGNKLTAIAKAKERIINWKKTLNISFKIFVPENVSTDLSTSGGSISLMNLSGTEDFRTSGGSLTVKKLSGKIIGETSGGSINVSDSKDDIDLGTSGGSIDADNCTGKIRLNTSGGSLSLQDLHGEIKATTSGGSVNGKNISGELSAHTSGGNVSMYELACSIDASTSGGNINVEIKEIGKYVKLNNSGGHISLQIPKDKGYDLKLYGEKMDRDFSLNNFSGTVKENKIEGTMNGGGIPITVDAGGGKINLSFR
jgi:putative adhesin